VVTDGSVAISVTDDLVLVMIAGSGAGGGSAGVGASAAVAVVVNTVCRPILATRLQVTALGNGAAVSFFTGAAGKDKNEARGVLLGAYTTEDIIILTVVSGCRRRLCRCGRSFWGRRH
jgi:hypothetical protein